MISKTKSEIEKYPYYGRINESKREEDYLSEKMCCETIRIRKKTVKKLKRLFAIIDLLCRLKSSLDPNQAIGLPIQVPTAPAIVLSMNSESYIPKKAIITEVMSYSCESTSFTENEMSRIYDLATSSLSKHIFLASYIHNNKLTILEVFS